MSDTIVGEKLVGLHERDAIHCAVAPITASERLKPGTHVSLNEEGQAQNKAPYLGIIDPFLKEQVEKGEQCWLFLYPRTITSLKHNWSHPAFKASFNPALEAINRSVDWVKEYANEIGVSYEELMDGADKGELFMGDKEPDFNEEFWDHYEIIRNKTVTERYSFFRCAC